jgi:16S rRNA (uracil1498-N3)-methyltransferase
VFCDRSERKNINKERFEKNSINRYKQSNAVFYQINDAISFKDFKKLNPSGIKNHSTLRGENH